jgi:hypothetical protein
MMVTELATAFEVGSHLDAIGVVWLVGGSVASSLFGEPRAAANIDLVTDLRERHVTEFLRRMSAYHVDADAVRKAVVARGSFNVIHVDSITKLDVFCAKDDPLSREQLGRRVPIELDGRKLPVSSPEDIILQKLLWYVEGNRAVDRQWRDAIGVCRVRGGLLDRAYIERHAAVVGVGDLVRAMFAEVG